MDKLFGSSILVFSKQLNRDWLTFFNGIKIYSQVAAPNFANYIETYALPTTFNAVPGRTVKLVR